MIKGKEKRNMILALVNTVLKILAGDNKSLIPTFGMY